MLFTIVSAVNNDSVLNSCLLASPGIGDKCDVILQRSYSDASIAYNEAISRAKTNLVIFAHQDVFFPEGWLERLGGIIADLEKSDPNWGVLGVWGVSENGVPSGHVYCMATGRILGHDNTPPTPVMTLDEVILIVKKSSGLLFDSKLKGFHFYGTDICLEAKSKGMRSYSISSLCIHNTNGYKYLPYAFWANYLFIRRKWKSQLPIHTSCTIITRWCLPVIVWNIRRVIMQIRGRLKPNKRVPDPRILLHKLSLP